MAPFPVQPSLSAGKGGAASRRKHRRYPGLETIVSTITAPLLKRPGKEWPGHSLVVSEPLRLDCGIDFGPFTISYQTYGRLNAERSNAVLICHALSGDQYVPQAHPITGAAGACTTLVAPAGVP